MKIGIDTRPLCEKEPSGIPVYVDNVLTALSRLQTNHEFILYAHRDFPFHLTQTTWKKRVGSGLYGTMWMQTQLPLWLIQDHIDIFWGTQHILPLLSPRSIRMFLTVHDLIYLRYPETMTWKSLTINKLLIPSSLKRADFLVAISESTAQDIAMFYEVNSKPLRVVPEGISSQFYPRPKEEARSLIETHFNVTSPYLLVIGTFEPRKNFLGCVEAFLKIADQIPHCLLLVGPSGWKMTPFSRRIRPLLEKGRAKILGFVPQPLMPFLYSAADLFLFPSLYEGFGLPPLEAMACATPVVASQAGSLPEVLGESAVWVDPHDSNSIAQGIMRLLRDVKLQSDLIQKGLSRTQLYRWDRTAAAILEIINGLC
ncbi:MAG: glycosyltransferase family 4 protein [Elusimicrobia bacterium]|nr:glycosyltransferase family 4 protein [Elusimicrobiota bacterium]